MALSDTIQALKHSGIAVIPTDTLYGVVARALDKRAVRRLYRLRRRAPRKPFIVLISSRKDLAMFGCQPDAAASRFLRHVWPGKVSVILPCASERFSYLHLGTETLAFRLPKSKWLISLLKKTGPLVAPSANPEGKKPAETITEAKEYFGRKVDSYISANRLLNGIPSTLITFEKNRLKVLRGGAVKVF